MRHWYIAAAGHIQVKRMCKIFRQRVVGICNKLSPEVVSAEGINVFEISLDQMRSEPFCVGVLACGVLQSD